MAVRYPIRRARQGTVPRRFPVILSCGINWRNMSDVIYAPFSFINSFVDVLSYIRLFAVSMSSLLPTASTTRRRALQALTLVDPHWPAGAAGDTCSTSPAAWACSAWHPPQHLGIFRPHGRLLVGKPYRPLANRNCPEKYNHHSNILSPKVRPTQRPHPREQHRAHPHKSHCSRSGHSAPSAAALGSTYGRRRRPSAIGA